MAHAKRCYYPGDTPVPGYRLVEQLGRGNFGAVWLASGPGGMEVALKIINLSGREGVKEFEALQRVKHIRHANLVPLFAAWLVAEEGQVLEDLSSSATNQLLQKTARAQLAVTQDIGSARPIRLSALIIAMGLGSKSLAQRLEECQAEGKQGIPREELLDAMEGAARGIDYLNQPIHDLGQGPVPIIHGDIKPHNILLVGDGVQVCDFGLARAVESLRKTSTGMGTFAYAAPELLDGKACRSSDQYCLAVTYFELCSGDLPFSETNPLKVVELHRRGDLDLSKLLPAEVEVIRRATSVDPARRWPSCMEMVRALRRANGVGLGDARGGTSWTATDYQTQPEATAAQRLGGTAVVTPVAAPSAVRPTAAGSAIETAAGTPAQQREHVPQPRRRRLRWAAVAVVTPLLLGVVAYFSSSSVKNPVDEWLGIGPPKPRIEHLIAQGKIKKAFNLADTLFENTQKRGELVACAIDCWTQCIVGLAKDGEYDKAVADVDIAPSLPEVDAVREKKRRQVSDAWSQSVAQAADAGKFSDALANYDRFASLFADSVRQETLRQVTNAGKRSVAEALEKGRFADALVAYNAVGSRCDEEVRQGMLRQIADAWSRSVIGAAGEGRFSDAFDSYAKDAASFPVHRKDVARRLRLCWSEKTREWVGQDQFDKVIETAREVKEKLLPSIPAAEAKLWNEPLGNARAKWVERIDELISKRKSDEAVKIWKMGRSAWPNDRPEQEMIEAVFKAIEGERDGLAIDGALKALVGIVSGSKPEQADRIHVRGARRFVGLEQYAYAQDWLKGLSSPPPNLPPELLPLAHALKIIADFNVSGDRKKAKEELEKLSPSGKWALNKLEEMALQRIRDDVIPPPPPPPPPSTPDVDAKIAEIEQLIQAGKCDDAIKAAGELLLKSANLTGQQVDRLCRALQKPSSREHVDRIMALIREYFATKLMVFDQPAATLAELWKKRIEMSIREGDRSLVETFRLFERDQSRLLQPKHSLAGHGLVDAWRTECLLEQPALGNPKALPNLNDVPDDMLWYAHYVRARCREREYGVPSLSWKAIAEELHRVGPPPRGIGDVLDRKGKAEGLAVRAAVGILDQQEVSGGLLSCPFSSAQDADLCYDVLQRVAPMTGTDETARTLAVAAFYKTTPDLATTKSQTARLVKRNNDREKYAARVLFVYLRTHLGSEANLEERTTTLEVGARLCGLLKDNLSGDADAKMLYQEILDPIQKRLRENPPAAGDWQEAIRRRDFYGAVCDLVSSPKHSMLSWPVPCGPREWLVELLSKTIELDEGLEPARRSSLLTSRYFSRAQARLKQSNPAFEVLKVVIADLEKVSAVRPADCDVLGLLCKAYRLQSRLQSTLSERIADLGVAVESGEKAIRPFPRASHKRGAWLPDLSRACLDRGNYNKETQQEDLRKADGYASEAIEIMNSLGEDRDFPYLELGNAKEDVAFLLEEKPEENYLVAIDTFEKAQQNQQNQWLSSAEACCAIGRCYYRMVVVTCLYPGVKNRQPRDRNLEKCRKALEKAIQENPRLAEAYFWLAQARKYEADQCQSDAADWRARAKKRAGSETDADKSNSDADNCLKKAKELYDAADKWFEKAKDLAIEQKLSSQMIYALNWARFPLDNASLESDEQIRQAKARAETVRKISFTASDALVNPAKEHAWIEATELLRKVTRGKRGKVDPQVADQCLNSAIDVCTKNLPETLERAGCADLDLLLCRVRARIELGKRQKKAELLNDAIGDAQCIARLALQREWKAIALAKEASAREELAAVYSIDNRKLSESELDLSIKKYEEAIEYTKRRPDSVMWSNETAKLRCFELFVRPTEASPQEKLTLCKKMVRFARDGYEWANSLADSDKLENELKGMLTRSTNWARDVLADSNVSADPVFQAEINQAAKEWNAELESLRQKL
jgi:serine/threonine protein kinase